jgi:hypothetical protein
MKTGLTFCLSLFISLVSTAQIENIPDVNSSNIDSLRSELANTIFGEEAIPEFKLCDQKDTKSTLALQYPPQHMGRMEVGIVTLKYGFTSKIYIIHPQRDNGLNIPIIYHSGHGYGVFREDALVNYDSLTISHFLSEGFTVIGIDMPFMADNTSPIEVTEDNYTHAMWGHVDLFYLKNPFYYFMAPIRSVIDFLQTNRNYNEFIMYGLSGGGWSTTLYSAIDTRIKLSFPVAGSVPIPIRQERDMGDMEQFYPPFYDRYNYSTLYFLGSAGAGRKQYQVLIKKDQCCFAYDGKVLWEKQINDALKKAGVPGTYEFSYDTVSSSHHISTLALDSIQTHVVSDMINEKMRELFSLSSSRESNTICDNDTMQLNLPEIGINTLEWYFNGKKIDTATSYAYTVNKEGQYNVVVQNLSGGVIATKSIEIKRQNIFSTPVITKSGNKIYSSYGEGNMWYFNGQRIAGVTTGSLILTKTGRYTVRVTSLKCTSDLSEPFDYGVTILPNPSATRLTVRLDQNLETIFWSLRTTQGAEVMKGQFVGETVISYNNAVKPGIYFLILRNRKGFNNVQKVLVTK